MAVVAFIEFDREASCFLKSASILFNRGKQRILIIILLFILL